MDAHGDGTVLRNGAVVEKGGEGRQRIERFCPETRIYRQLESAEIVGAPRSEVEPEPHEQPADRSRCAGDLERAPEFLDLGNRPRSCRLDQCGKLSDRPTLWAFDLAEQDHPLTLVFALMGDGRYAFRIFVELRPWKFHICAPELRHFPAKKRISL
ncbi:hypothetical protein D3C72_1956340 [compost metagenome]